MFKFKKDSLILVVDNKNIHVSIVNDGKLGSYARCNASDEKDLKQIEEILKYNKNHEVMIFVDADNVHINHVKITLDDAKSSSEVINKKVGELHNQEAFVEYDYIIRNPITYEKDIVFVCTDISENLKKLLSICDKVALKYKTLPNRAKGIFFLNLAFSKIMRKIFEDFIEIQFMPTWISNKQYQILIHIQDQKAKIIVNEANLLKAYVVHEFKAKEGNEFIDELNAQIHHVFFLIRFTTQDLTDLIILSDNKIKEAIKNNVVSSANNTITLSYKDVAERYNIVPQDAHEVNFYDLFSLMNKDIDLEPIRSQELDKIKLLQKVSSFLKKSKYVTVALIVIFLIINFACFTIYNYKYNSYESIHKTLLEDKKGTEKILNDIAKENNSDVIAIYPKLKHYDKTPNLFLSKFASIKPDYVTMQSINWFMEDDKNNIFMILSFSEIDKKFEDKEIFDRAVEKFINNIKSTFADYNINHIRVFDDKYSIGQKSMLIKVNFVEIEE